MATESQLYSYTCFSSELRNIIHHPCQTLVFAHLKPDLKLLLLLFGGETYHNNLAQASIEGFLDRVPGVGDVRQRVPSHGQKLENAKDDGQALFVQGPWQEIIQLQVPLPAVRLPPRW